MGAEKHALKSQHLAPGAEHFLLAALELPDGSARRVFQRVQADPFELPLAVTRQYDDALRYVGIDPDHITSINGASPPLAKPGGLYRAAASGQAVMQNLSALRKKDKDIPLLGAHVVAAIAEQKQGVAARSLRAMGIDLDALQAAANEEIRTAS